MSTGPKTENQAEAEAEALEAARIDGELMGYLYALQPGVEGLEASVRRAVTEARELGVAARQASSEWPITNRVSAGRR